MRLSFSSDGVDATTFTGGRAQARPQSAIHKSPKKSPAQPVVNHPDPSPEELGLWDWEVENSEKLNVTMAGMHDKQKCLVLYGVCVIPTQFADSANLERVQKEFWQMMRESPELLSHAKIEHDDDWKPSLGGFAALGNPSSFHHNFARKIREIALFEVLRADALPLKGRKLEKTFDRMMLRRPCETPTAELVHRDVAKKAKKGDDVFGGWLNISSSDQRFLCCPRTHTEVGDDNTGFALLTTPKLRKHYKSQIRKVVIPPGHMMVFYERLVHEVASTNDAQDNVLRCHVGFRVTDDEEPLFGKAETHRWVAEQAVPKIKSGQVPRIYPAAYPNFPLRHNDAMTQQANSVFAKACRYEHIIDSGDLKGRRFTRVKPAMHSLLEYTKIQAKMLEERTIAAHEATLKLLDPYSEHEVEVLFPQAAYAKLRASLEGDVVDVKLPSKKDFKSFALGRDIAPEGATVRRPSPEIFAV